MEKYNSFKEIPNPQDTPKVEVEAKAEVRLEKHELMLEQMGVSKDDKEKLGYKEFFDLAMERCGGMGNGRETVNSSRRVILASIYQKAFIAYYGLKGPQKNVEYSKVFDKMNRNKEIDFIPHRKGTDSYLASPILE